MKRILFIASILLLFMSVPVWAQENAAPSIVINLPARMLLFYSGDQMVKEYPIAIGSPATPTPLGLYSIISKEINPWWYDPETRGRVVPSGPYNPLGYRWMGIGANYGIHGTNMPWSIGHAVSHGCIRMHEADVEELFDLVTYGTPVKIIYDRVKLKVNKENNTAIIGIYPDIYGYGPVTLTVLKNKISESGLVELVDQATLNDILNKGEEAEIQLAKRVTLKINGVELSRPALNIGGKILVPVWAIASSIMCDLTWDAKQETVMVGDKIVKGEVRNNIIYVASEDIQVLFGGTYTFQSDTLDYSITLVYVNGKRTKIGVIKQDQMLSLSAIELAQTLKRKATWNAAEEKFMLEGKSVPVSVVANQPYIKINQVMDYFSAYLYWNPAKGRIELSYPAKSI